MITLSFNDFLKRWNLGIETNSNVEFKKLIIRIKNILGENEDYRYGIGNVKEYCNILGVEYDSNSPWNIWGSLFNDLDDKTFLYRLEILFSFNFSYNKAEFVKFIKKVFEYSEINISLVEYSGQISFYPKGEKTLDEVLVEKTLTFLNESSNTHFLDGLTSYQQNSPQSRIKSTNSLRRALEEFLKFKLKNNKGLKENIKELMERLKSDKRDPFVRNIIRQSLSELDDYFNENSKHNDGDISEEENEFLVYQTGLLCRYIDKSIV